MVLGWPRPQLTDFCENNTAAKVNVCAVARKSHNRGNSGGSINECTPYTNDVTGRFGAQK